MTQPASRSDKRLAHGVALMLFMACTLSIPALRRWPWVWLVPLVAYFLLVACYPPLRHSLGWFRVGRLSPAAVAATVEAMFLTTSTLLAFHIIAQPDVRGYRAFLPRHA